VTGVGLTREGFFREHIHRPYMLGGWVNPHREQQTIPQGQNIEPAPKNLHANGQSAPRSGGARDVGRGAGSHTPSTASESFSQDTDDKVCTYTRGYIVDLYTPT